MKFPHSQQRVDVTLTPGSLEVNIIAKLSGKSGSNLYSISLRQLRLAGDM